MSELTATDFATTAPSRLQGRVRKVVWLSGTLNQVGGGERLALEGVKHFVDQGITTHLVTWNFHPRALFDGRYSAEHITILSEPDLPGRGTIARTLRRAGTLRALRARLREWRPDVVVCQSEYDCIVAWLATRGLGIPYAVEIFGQMYQFETDFGKYTLAFRRHLKEIRASRLGYMETVPLEPPRIGLATRLVQETLGLARRLAVRGAICIGTLSRQVQWEVGLLYGRPTVVLKGAYDASIFQHRPRTSLRDTLRAPGELILSVCRLVPKKRVHVLIRAFAKISSRFPRALLVVGGTGFQAYELQELAQDLGIADRVRFLGYVPEHDLYDHVASADLCVSIDIADFDIAAYEPLALGTRTLWSNEHEVDDDLKTHPLLLTTQPTVDAVAEAMTNALQQPRPPKTEALMAPLRQYTWSARFERLRVALENALAAR